MCPSHIDHMTITAPSLAVGVEYVREVLGVTAQPGGEHPRMGTHNCFVKLGKKVYLEIIAVNPRAPAPNRPRWFQLDDAVRTPRLATWIARTDDVRAAAHISPIALGKVEPMSRGSFSWLITIPEDGSLPLQGVAPTLIEWPAGIHPTETLTDLGCTLVRLQGFHPDPEKVSSVLSAIGLEGEFSVSALPPGERPYLVAHIETRAGLKQLT